MDDGVYFGALLTGIIIGLIPIIYGLKKEKIGLAIGGFFVCVISGLFFGLLLAIPAVTVVVYLIWKKSKQ